MIASTSWRFSMPSIIKVPSFRKLWLHLALLYQEALGSVETFRPYAEPDPGCWEQRARVGEKG
jgi:hypothetical protein